MNRKLYDFISSYQLVVSTSLLLLAIATRNTYLITYFLALIVFAYLPQELIKKALGNSQINRRPSCAYNCDILNQGKDYTDKPGFPSGHVSFASFVFFYTLLEYRHDRGLLSLMISTFVMTVLMGIARYGSCCHTPAQIAGGFVLGGICALAFYWVDHGILGKYKRYATDKEKFYSLFKI